MINRKKNTERVSELTGQMIRRDNPHFFSTDPREQYAAWVLAQHRYEEQIRQQMIRARQAQMQQKMLRQMYMQRMIQQMYAEVLRRQAQTPPSVPSVQAQSPRPSAPIPPSTPKPQFRNMVEPEQMVAPRKIILPKGTPIWDAEVVEEIKDKERANNPIEQEILRFLNGGKGRVSERDVADYIDRLAMPHRKKAESRYQMWHDREPNKDIYTAFKWPTEQVLIGQATAIGYTSDKWDKVGKKKDYIHHFDRPYPRLIIQKPSKHEISGLGPAAAMGFQMKSIPNHKRVKPPKSRAFTPLGYCLDIEYIRPDGMISNLDFKSAPTLPFLAVDAIRNVLIIVQETGNGYAVLLDSPIVEITPRGIEN